MVDVDIAPDLWMPDWSERLYRPMRYKVPRGGRGSSKSWTIARALLQIALEPSMLPQFTHKTKLRILCAREFQNSIAESVHALLETQIDKMGLTVRYKVTDKYIGSENGSEFIFAGIKTNVNKIKSMEDIDICWVEEAETVSNHSWQTLIPTVRSEGSEIWISFNPNEESDPTYKRFVLNPPEDCDSFMVNWRDNPWFPLTLKKEKDYLFRVDPEAAMHVWEGQCNTRSNAVIFRGKYTSRHFIPREPNTGEWLGPYYGADWGFAQDPTVLSKLWVNLHPKLGPRLMIEKQSWELQLELNDIADRWRKDIPEVGNDIIRADNARPETISHVRGYGLNVISCEKWPGSIEDGIAYFRSFTQIVIHPQCAHQLEEARLYKYKVDKLTGDVLKDIVDKHNHCWDADRYAMEPAIRTAMEITLSHQEDVTISSDLDNYDQGGQGWNFNAW